MMTNSYWGSIFSRWLPWFQPKEETKMGKTPLSFPSFTGTKKAVERYLGPTLHTLLEEAFTQNPRRCQRCNSGNIDRARRNAVDTKAVIEAALELHRQGDIYFVNMEQLEQHISTLYKEQIAASPVLCKECLRKRQGSMQRESYRFPDLSVYKTPELKLGPNITPSGRTEKPFKNTPAEGLNKLRYSASEFAVLQKMKIGELVKETFPQLMQKGILSEATILELQNPSRSKAIFNVHFSVLKKLNGSPASDIWKDDKGYSRYYSKPLKWKNSTYILTSQWYRGSHDLYLKWLRNFIVVENE